MDQHDVSTGLRENWNARRRWKMAISGVQAAVRMSRAASVSSSLSSATTQSSISATTVRTSGEYHTADDDDEDEGEETETDRETTSGQQSPRPYIQYAGTSDKDAQTLAQDTHRQLDSDMNRVLQKADELEIRK
jgi:hypothetical protein